MKTYKVQMNRNFGISKDVSNKRLISVLLFLSLAAYQSVLLSEPAHKMNILGTSLLSSPSEAMEEGFLERFSSGAFPGQPPRYENKKSTAIQKDDAIPTINSMSVNEKTDKKRESSFHLLVPHPRDNGVILRKYNSVIDRVNMHQSENDKTRGGNSRKETNANRTPLAPLVYGNDSAEPAPFNPSLEFHNEPVDFDIDLTDTGINVRYLW